MEFIKRTKEQAAAARLLAATGSNTKPHSIVLGATDNKRIAPCQGFDKAGNLLFSSYAWNWVEKPEYTTADENDVLTCTPGREFSFINGAWGSVPDTSVQTVNGVTITLGKATPAAPAVRTKAIVQAEIDAAKAADDFDKAANLKAELTALTV